MIAISSSKYPLPPPPACIFCGGNKAMRQHAKAGLAAHNLCAARAARGDVTPSLGDEVVPTQPNQSGAPMLGRPREDVVRMVRSQIVADVELIELTADYIVATGSCVWHAAAVVSGTECHCAECATPQAVRS